MNISSAKYWPYSYSTQNSSAATTSTNGTSSNSQVQFLMPSSGKTEESSTLDSEAAALFFSGQMNQGMMPMPNAGGQDDEIKTFLDKVQSGTVTDTDLAAMQDTLSQLTAVTSTTSLATSSRSADSSYIDIKDFLDKVKDGTVTDADLSAMKDQLTTMQSGVTQGMMMPPPPPSPMDSGMQLSSNDDDLQSTIANFLEKVKNGTVTDTDLTAMEELLNQVQAASTTTDSAATTANSDSSSTKAVSQQLMRMASQAYDDNMYNYADSFLQTYNQTLKV